MLFLRLITLSHVSDRTAFLKAYYRCQLQFRQVSFWTLVGFSKALQSL